MEKREEAPPNLQDVSPSNFSLLSGGLEGDINADLLPSPGPEGAFEVASLPPAQGPHPAAAAAAAAALPAPAPHHLGPPQAPAHPPRANPPPTRKRKAGQGAESPERAGSGPESEAGYEAAAFAAADAVWGPARQTRSQARRRRTRGQQGEGEEDEGEEEGGMSDAPEAQAQAEQGPGPRRRRRGSGLEESESDREPGDGDGDGQASGDAADAGGLAQAPRLRRSGGRKQRLIWTEDLHRVFLEAVDAIGLATAVPRTVHAQMNVPGLARENVASHLQKYRLYLKKLGGYLPSQKIPPADLEALHRRLMERTGGAGRAGVGSMGAMLSGGLELGSGAEGFGTLRLLPREEGAGLRQEEGGAAAAAAAAAGGVGPGVVLRTLASLIGAAAASPSPGAAAAAAAAGAPATATDVRAAAAGAGGGPAQAAGVPGAGAGAAGAPSGPAASAGGFAVARAEGPLGLGPLSLEQQAALGPLLAQLLVGRGFEPGLLGWDPRLLLQQLVATAGPVGPVQFVPIGSRRQTQSQTQEATRGGPAEAAGQGQLSGPAAGGAGGASGAGVARPGGGADVRQRGRPAGPGPSPLGPNVPRAAVGAEAEPQAAWAAFSAGTGAGGQNLREALSEAQQRAASASATAGAAPTLPRPPPYFSEQAAGPSAASGASQGSAAAAAAAAASAPFPPSSLPSGSTLSPMGGYGYAPATGGAGSTFFEDLRDLLGSPRIDTTALHSPLQWQPSPRWAGLNIGPVTTPTAAASTPLGLSSHLNLNHWPGPYPLSPLGQIPWSTASPQGYLPTQGSGAGVAGGAGLGTQGHDIHAAGMAAATRAAPPSSSAGRGAPPPAGSGSGPVSPVFATTGGLLATGGGVPGSVRPLGRVAGLEGGLDDSEAHFGGALGIQLHPGFEFSATPRTAALGLGLSDLFGAPTPGGGSGPLWTAHTFGAPGSPDALAAYLHPSPRRSTRSAARSLAEAQRFEEAGDGGGGGGAAAGARGGLDGGAAATAAGAAQAPAEAKPGQRGRRQSRFPPKAGGGAAAEAAPVPVPGTSGVGPPTPALPHEPPSHPGSMFAFWPPGSLAATSSAEGLAAAWPAAFADVLLTTEQSPESHSVVVQTVSPAQMERLTEGGQGPSEATDTEPEDPAKMASVTGVGLDAAGQAAQAPPAPAAAELRDPEALAAATPAPLGAGAGAAAAGAVAGVSGGAEAGEPLPGPGLGDLSRSDPDPQ